MRKRYIVAADRNDRQLGVVGIYSTFEKAMKACENHYNSTYKGVSEIDWTLEYDGEDLLWCDGKDHSGYDLEYLCWECYIDMDVNEGHGELKAANKL